MKLNRKFIACALATTMAVAPMSAFAADEDISEIKDAKATIEGEGGLEGWVEKDKFLVTLPTVDAEGLKFTLDPQGLIEATDDETEYVAGSVIFDDEKSVVTLVNKSSYAIGFDVKLTLKSSDKDLKVVASEELAKAEEDTNRNIFIAAQPVENDAVVEDHDQILATPETAVEGVAGIKKFAYALKDADDQYEITKVEDEYVYDLKTEGLDEEAFDKVSFGFTGVVNPNADWSNYTGENADDMSLELSYTIKKLGVAYNDETAADLTVEGVHGLLKTEECVGVKAAPSAPVEAAFLSGYNVKTVYTTVINDVSLGEGDLAATKIASIKVGTTELNALTEVPTTYSTKGYIYDAEAETLTLYGPVIAASSDYTKTADLVVTFNDTANTSITIKLTNTARPTE